MTINKLEDSNFSELDNLPERTFNIINETKFSTKEIVNNDFYEIIEFLKSGYYNLNKSKLIYNFSGIFSNPDFLKYINEYVKETFKNIFNDNESYDFENISFSMFLLSGINYSNPLKDINNYDYEDLSIILDDGLKKLEICENQDEFDIYFDRFYNIFELSHKLSIFNKIDSDRYELIEKLLVVVNYYIEYFHHLESDFLTQEHKNYVLNISGEILLNFNHIDIEYNKYPSIDETLKYVYNKINLQEKGFEKCEKSNFGNDKKQETFTFQVYVGNMTKLIYESLNELLSKNYTFDQIKNSDYFVFILNKYFSKLGINFQNFEELSLVNLKNLLNNSIAYIYFENDEFLGEISENNKITLLNDFITHNNHNSHQIESIYNIILFNLDNFNLSYLLKVSDFLLDVGVYNNYNFEYFKLRIFDLIIRKLDKNNLTTETQDFLDKLINYIEKTKTASQLLKSYSYLHRAIAYYYSFFDDENSQENARMHHYFYRKTNGFFISSTPKSKRHEEFVKNIGNVQANNNRIELTQESQFNFGVLSLNQYGDTKDKDNRSEIDSYLSDYLNNALTNHEFIESNMNFFNDLGDLLSSKLFYGVSQVFIKDTRFNENLNLHNGMSIKEIELFDGYSLVFIFPNIQRDLFEKIFEKEKDYITLNLKNLISSYLKTKENYEQTKKAFLDNLTGLPNQAKLNTDLSKIEIFSFLNIKLNSVSKINNGLGFERGNEYIKSVAEELNKIPSIKGKVYKLSGVQFGIIIENEEDIDSIIDEIRDLDIVAFGKSNKIVCLIGGVKSCKEEYIEKTNRALSLIQKQGNNIAFYDECVHDEESYKKLLEYGFELKNAILEGRLITHYQKIVDSKTKKVYKREALMRVVGKDGNIVSPFEYLNSAKEFGYLPLIASEIIDRVFNDLRDNPNLSFSINLSGEDLDSLPVIKKLEDSIGIYSVNPENITLEILEGGWDSGNDKIGIIKKLKNLGFKIAIDDFGAGESGINRLNKLFNLGIIDYVKIDGEILKNLLSKDEFIYNSALLDIKFIVDKSNLILDSTGKKKIKVIAEFVENEDISNKCIELGVDYLQGYYYSKPGTLS